MDEKSLKFIDHQRAEFERVIDDYKLLARILEAILLQASSELGINAIVQSRPKDLISYLNKCYKKQEELNQRKVSTLRPFAHSFTDLCGARVIVEYRSQAKEMCDYIRRHFEIDERNSVDPKVALRSNEFSYRADHLIVSLKSHEFTDILNKVKNDKSSGVPKEKFDEVVGRLFERRDTIVKDQDGALLPIGPMYKAEVQVKTLLEHAWSNIQHDRIYKGDIKPPAELSREMNRVSALLEEADEVFARVVKDIDAYGTHIRKFLPEKEREAERDWFEYSIKQAPNRAGLAIRYAQLLAEKKEWGRVVEVLTPHLTLWQQSTHGVEFTRTYNDFNQNQNIVTKKRAETQLTQLGNPQASSLLMELGWAKTNAAENNKIAKREARELLEQAALLDNRNAEARLRLGRTYELRSAERLTHYEAAFDIAPGDPGVLEEFLYTKLIHGRTLADLPLLRASLLEAITTCRRRADIGVCLPGAYFQIGFFKSLLEQGQKQGPNTATAWSHPKVMQSLVSSLIAYTKAAELTSNEDDLSDHRNQLLDLCNSLGAHYPGSDWMERLLQIEFAAKVWANARRQINKLEKDRETAAQKGEPVNDESVKKNADKLRAEAGEKAMARCKDEASRSLPKFSTPLVIFVGSCSEASEAIISRFRTHVENALEHFKGTVIGGGTSAGISGIVGAARTRPESVQKLAYVRSGLKNSSQHKLLEKQAETEGYELRYLEGDGFTPMEILQMWTDILAAGINPADVTVLGINGGQLSAFEMRLALSLGAMVGAVRESGGAAREILDDPDWKQHPRLLDIPDDVQTVKALIDANRVMKSFAPDERDQAAKKLHNETAEKRRSHNMRPADRDWNELSPFFQRDVRERIAYWDVLLEAVGMRLCKLDEAPKGEDEVKKFTDKEMELMAEMEHARWIINRLSGGQRYGPEKRDEKTHPDIVPWRQLSMEDQDKDRKYVAQILRAHEFEYGIFRIDHR